MPIVGRFALPGSGRNAMTQKVFGRGNPKCRRNCGDHARQDGDWGRFGGLSGMVRALKSGEAGPLRVGVIGVGIMGANHARVFAGLPDVTLVGVADPEFAAA